MGMTALRLSYPWRTGRSWDVPRIERAVTKELARWLNAPEILILSGPRQVGKTSILYQLIDWLIRPGRTRPEDIYFFNLDLTGSAEFLEDQGRFLRFLGTETERKLFVFIDEVKRLPDPGIFIKALQELRLPLKFILTHHRSIFVQGYTRR